MTHCILRESEILAKKKSTENQVISVLCGDLPFCPVTPEISGLYHLITLIVKEL